MFGLFRFADGLKMFVKEDFIPAEGNRFLHGLAPFVAAFFALVGFAAIPFGSTVNLFGREIPLQVIDLNVGVLYIFAVMSLGIYGVVLAGWSSNNNYAFLGGMRGSSQMFSYEVTIGATILGVLMIFESMSLQEIVRAQGALLWGVIPKWGVIVQPLGCILFLIAGIAETKRIPFDLPEGESEIIGFFVEYSSMKFGLFMLTDFVETRSDRARDDAIFRRVASALLMADGFHFPGGSFLAVPQLGGNPAGTVVASDLFFLLVYAAGAAGPSALSLRSAHAAGVADDFPTLNSESAGHSGCDFDVELSLWFLSLVETRNRRLETRNPRPL
jgi:NADH-quinone oxidoreductase subunit H